MSDRVRQASVGFKILLGSVGRSLAIWPVFAAGAWLAALCSAAAEEVQLPQGVRAVWDLSKAARDATPSRERICINGLWRWQPADAANQEVPAGDWGYFKLPGCWPGITDYMQKDCQTVYAHPRWKDQRLGSVAAAWYQREIEVPAGWKGRRIALRLACVNSYAAVYIDGNREGEIRFPGGDVDLTIACRPGGSHTLSVLVVAMPLRGVMLSYSDTASAKEVKGSVARRGLCGDAYLIGEPAGPRIADTKVSTSVRKWEIAIDAALENLAPDAQYSLRVRASAAGQKAAEFTSKPLSAKDLVNGRFSFTSAWKPEKLWDLHTPENQYDLDVSLVDGQGKALDFAHRERFGFREFWIDGKDFYLNGTRLYLSALPLDNAQVSAGLATYPAAKESLLRLQNIGINFVYTHNYGCEPGSHLAFDELLRAADDVGMLVSFSQPHFAHYDWKAAGADASNGYRRHAEAYVRMAQNHPSVVCYSMSHNATGYSEDMNPHMIDGIQHGRDSWALNNAKLAQRAEAIVQGLDPSRFVYHHASGNLAAMHLSNFYPNFVPVQELSDWFEHWATAGVKPVFLCEYGAPFSWDWTMYRGWYKGQRSFGSAKVPWEFCLAEWNAQFLGDRAFPASDAEKANLRWEAKQFHEGNLWHRWDYPYEVGSREFSERYPVFALYLEDNWRAFRTWGVSAISPWEHGIFWKLRGGVSKGRKDLPVDWENLQRPGFSPDYIEGRYERMDLAFERSDWEPTAAAQAILRNNRPLLAYLGGKPDRFTSKDHNFHPGETLQKQIIAINNSRRPVACGCEYALNLPEPLTGKKTIDLQPGQQAKIPLRFELPASLAPGVYGLHLKASFRGVEVQEDRFTVHVLPLAPPSAAPVRIALFDPKGETGQLLTRLGLRFDRVEADADRSGYDLLIVGKNALTVDGPGPDISASRGGAKVVVFEQSPEVLEQRLGFRIATYGLRQAFQRVSGHPILAGIENENLRDWRGAATIVPERLKYEMRPMHGPTIKWCDIPVTHAWRCGNQGNVATALIEKPARGDFLPLIDGGYSLQYSPLMECREGNSLVLFCQMDVTGRTESDPAADRLARNLIDYAAAWKPGPARKAVYVGEPIGKRHLEKAGVRASDYDGEALSPEHVLIVGPGAGSKLAGRAAALSEWLGRGGNMLAIGIDERDVAALPLKLVLKKAEHISTSFEPFAFGSPPAGIGPADVHNRDPKILPLAAGGAQVFGNGVLAKADNANAILCQLAPWEFKEGEFYPLKRTYRRSSFVVARLLAGMGVAGPTPILARIGSPAKAEKPEKRWLDGLYLDQPEEWDYPYRFFRW